MDLDHEKVQKEEEMAFNGHYGTSWIILTLPMMLLYLRITGGRGFQPETTGENGPKSCWTEANCCWPMLRHGVEGR